MSTRFCPDCKSPYVSRVRRIGMLQTIVLPLFGLYPWHCEDCAHTFRCRARRKLRLYAGATPQGIAFPYTQR